MIKIRRKLKKSIKRTIVIFVLIISIIIFIVSFYNIIMWKIYSKKVLNQINEIESLVEINEYEAEEEEIIEHGEISKSNPYWDFIKTSLIDVDFSELKIINNEVKGWIQVGGTNINYPFVQGADNIYYLSHSFDKNYNQAGWVFLDYRNNISSFKKNNIIYAHGRTDKTMFGSLRNVLSSNWFENTNNHIIKMSSETENTLWQVFSVYNILTTNDYLIIDFNNNTEFLEFGNMLIKRSIYNFNVPINENDIILTLSTCYNKTNKIVLHAKLIKKSIKI